MTDNPNNEHQAIAQAFLNSMQPKFGMTPPIETLGWEEVHFPTLAKELEALLQSERKAVVQAIREKILKNTQDFEEVSADGDETWFEYLDPKTVLEILEGVE